MNLNKSLFYKISITIVFIYGIAVRLLALADARSLWRDEAPVALSIIQNSIFSIFGNILDNQKAPILFWLETKITQMMFGNSEIALRLIPFICAILSVFVFFILSKKFLRNKYSIVIANLLFAVNLRLIYFSQDLKPYSGDVLFFMLALILYEKFAKTEYTKKSLTVFVLVSLFIMLSSFPACIVLGALIIYKLINFKKDSSNKKLYYTGVSIIGISALIYFCTYLYPMFHSEIKGYSDFWAPGFINIHNIHEVIMNFYNYMFKPVDNSLFLIILTVIGIIFVIKNKTPKAKLVIISLTCILLLSVLNIYPIYQRIALYIVPLIILLMLNAADKAKYIKNNMIKIPVLLCIITAFISLYHYPKHMYTMVTNRTFTAWDGRETLKFIKDRYEPNDIIIVSLSSYLEYDYYKHYYNFVPENENVKILDFNKNNKQTLYGYLNNIEAGKNYWIYYSYPCLACIKPKQVINYINSKDIEIKDSKTVKKSYVLEICKKS